MCMLHLIQTSSLATRLLVMPVKLHYLLVNRHKMGNDFCKLIYVLQTQSEHFADKGCNSSLCEYLVHTSFRHLQDGLFERVNISV